jgi:aspartyl-tRNA(Asn)/glutamyl-tRNA(Gln) amidotransferase subunit C
MFMAVDKEAVRRIAKLARIGISESELEPMARELNAILTFVETLDQIDTAGVPPLTSVVAAHLKQRDDVVSEGGEPEAVLKNAPERIDDYFVVPKVVE